MGMSKRITSTDNGNAGPGDVVAPHTFTSQFGVGQVGTITDRNGAGVASPTAQAITGRVALQPPSGFYDGVTQVYKDDAYFIPGNIPNGITMLGLAGTGKRIATGTVNIANGSEVIITVPFAYRVIIVQLARPEILTLGAAKPWDNSAPVVFSLADTYHQIKNITATTVTVASQAITADYVWYAIEA